MEKTNIRYVKPEDLGEPIEFSSIDVSFISLTKVLGPIRDYLTPEGEIAASSSLSLRREERRLERKAWCGRRAPTMR